MEPRFESHLLLQSPGCWHYPSLAQRREATIEAIGWHLFAARVWGGKAARRLQELVSCEVMSAWARVISREWSIHVIGPDREEPGVAQHLTWSWMQLFKVGWGDCSRGRAQSSAQIPRCSCSRPWAGRLASSVGRRRQKRLRSCRKIIMWLMPLWVSEPWHNMWSR